MKQVPRQINSSRKFFLIRLSNTTIGSKKRFEFPITDIQTGQTVQGRRRKFIITQNFIYAQTGSYKEMSSILANQWRPSYMSLNAGEGGIVGSRPMRTAVHITGHGSQMNFGDLTPYFNLWALRAGTIFHPAFAHHTVPDRRHIWPEWGWRTLGSSGWGQYLEEARDLVLESSKIMRIINKVYMLSQKVCKNGSNRVTYPYSANPNYQGKTNFPQ